MFLCWDFLQAKLIVVKIWEEKKNLDMNVEQYIWSKQMYSFVIFWIKNAE